MSVSTIEFDPEEKQKRIGLMEHTKEEIALNGLR